MSQLTGPILKCGKRNTRPFRSIKWTKCKAKAIILEDLEIGLLPVDASELSAEEAWELVYQHMAEFNEVVFSQFEARLRDHRRRAKEQVTRSTRESEALAHDRHIFPRQMENGRGQPVFDLSSAKMLLRADGGRREAFENATSSTSKGTRRI